MVSSYPYFTIQTMNQNTLLTQFPKLHMVVAVSKNRPLSAIESKIQDGFSHFGENKAQELMDKAKAMYPVTWHFIGRIQTNKLKVIVEYASWIHSVDQVKQIEFIEKYAAFYDKNINILIQLNLTHEDQKGGIKPEDLEKLIETCHKCPHVLLKGLMVMGPSNGDLSVTEDCFKEAQEIFNKTQKNHPEMTELSMGMSHDYTLAYHYGSTCFRLGTILFT